MTRLNIWCTWSQLLVSSRLFLLPSQEQSQQWVTWTPRITGLSTTPQESSLDTMVSNPRGNDFVFKIKNSEGIDLKLRQTDKKQKPTKQNPSSPFPACQPLLSSSIKILEAEAKQTRMRSHYLCSQERRSLSFRVRDFMQTLFLPVV